MSKTHKEKTSVYFLLIAISSFFGLLYKIYLIIHNKSYIAPGNDTSTIMEHTQWIIKNGEYNILTITRPFEAYLAAIFKMTTGVSTTETFILNAIISPILGFLLTYLLSLELFGKKNIALISCSLFSAVLLISQVNSIVYFSLTLISFLFLILIKYLRGKTNFFLLLLIIVAGLNIYSQIFFIYLAIISIYMFFLELSAIKKQDEFLIKKTANYFLILILSFIIVFTLTNNVFPDYLKGFKRIFWFLGGLQRSSPELIEYMYKGFFLFLYICIVMFSLKFYWDKFRFSRKLKIIKTLLKFKNIFLKKFWFKYKINLSFAVLAFILINIVIIDIFLLTKEIYFFPKKVFEPSQWSLTFKILHSYLSSDVWRSISIITNLLSIFGILGILFFSFLRTKFEKYLILILIPIFLLFIGIIPQTQKLGLHNFGGIRGLSANYIFIIIISGFILYNLINYKPLLKIIITALVIIFFFNSLHFTKKISYSQQPETSFLEAVKWFEKNKKNNKFIYLNSYPLEESIANRPENFDQFLLFENMTKFYKYFKKNYIYTFFESDIPFKINHEINQKRLYFRDMPKFQNMLDQHQINYLIYATNINTERDYNNMKKLLEPRLKTVFKNEKYNILEKL